VREPGSDRVSYTARAELAVGIGLPTELAAALAGIYTLTDAALGR
jgi:hypothetical protein